MTEPPEVPESGRRLSNLLGRLRNRLEAWHLGLLAGILVAAGIAGFLWIYGDDSQPGTTAAPEDARIERGVACPHLAAASMHTRAGDNEALNQSVNAAARASEQALERSGQVFGRPERIAIELDYALGQQPDDNDAAAEFLAQAEAACEDLGRWPDTG